MIWKPHRKRIYIPLLLEYQQVRNFVLLAICGVKIYRRVGGKVKHGPSSKAAFTLPALGIKYFRVGAVVVLRLFGCPIYCRAGRAVSWFGRPAGVKGSV